MILQLLGAVQSEEESTSAVSRQSSNEEEGGTHWDRFVFLAPWLAIATSPRRENLSRALNSSSNGSS